MAIKQLSLNNFRNLKSATIDFNETHNVFFGDNGSGKTSLLESIHILCQGRSFKTQHLNQCIQHHKNDFLLFSKFDNYQAGVSKSNNKLLLRIDGQTIHKISELVERTPVVTISAQSFELIIGPPNNRREYVDWVLFHVEHKYRNLWLDYSRTLKQKNSLLKRKSNLQELDYWDKYLSRLCLEIYSYRFDVIEYLSKLIADLYKQLFDSSDITIRYIQGWKNKENPLEDFIRNRPKEIKLGYTLAGSHRDLIEIYIGEYPVKEKLSRGQLKKLSICFLIAQIIVVKNETNKSVILLLDDLESELDEISSKRVLKLLSDLEIQTFITNIIEKPYLVKYQQDYKMFHVEHGIIKPIKNS